MSSPSAELPTYNALFPAEEEANRTPRRRYTTITLREIYYPGGCPCHPIEKPSRKGKKKKCEHQPPTLRPDSFEINENLWLGHARPVMTDRSQSQSSESSSSTA